MQDDHHPTGMNFGEQDPNVDTNFLAFIAIAAVCLLALGYVLFPRHDLSSTVGPGASSTPSVGGGGPAAPSATPPASPPSNTPPAK